MSENRTSEQIRAVVEEINAWTQAAYPEEVAAGEWRIERIEHLRSLQDEAYRVTYTDGFQSLFQRDRDTGTLRSVASWSYEAADDFEDTHHKSAQQEAAPESEVRHA